jgi:hypothetical protein
MNARLTKESRDLLPMFLGTLPLIAVPQFIWPPAGFGYLALGVACVVMAGSVFGTEFQHRTLSLLLSQPIPRSVIWREKMLVLGAGMATSLAALLACLAISHPVIEGLDWLVLAFIPLCAFCGTPFWTLEMRQGMGGMVAAVGFPSAIMAVCGLLYQQLDAHNEFALVAVMLSLLLIYCAVVYCLGYAKFKRLEAVDVPSRELGLPAGLEAFLVRPLTRMSSRFRGPFATLLKKEFRLQQISFLLAGVFVLVAVAGFCVAARRPDISAGIVGGDLFIYVLILPLIAGAVSVGEERGWGMAEWHLTLPPSALKQWSAKMVAALSTSLVLGLLLPTIIFVAADPLFSKPGTGITVPPAFVILCWILGQLLLTSVAVYAASFTKNTMQAILAAFVILAALVGDILLAVNWVRHIARAPLPWIGLPYVGEQLILPLLSSALVLTLCLFHGFAGSNFRRHSLPSPRLSFQFILILLSVWLVAWFFFSALFPPKWG